MQVENCRHRVQRRRAFTLGFVATLFILEGRSAECQLRPLVQDMIQNLSAVNQIGEGVALEDYDLVREGALHLRDRARALKEKNLADLDLDPQRDAMFDAFLQAQEQSSEKILEAAKKADGRAAFAAVEELQGGPCLGCHRAFRESEDKLRPAVRFMTAFLTAWQEMNRGLTLNDFSLVARRVRELEAMGRVMSWEQTIKDAFKVRKEARQKEFRTYLNRVLREAYEIEQAAIAEDAAGIVEASRRMWNDGCIACHDAFR